MNDEDAPIVRAPFDTANVGIAVADRQGRLLEVNPSFCRFVGRTAEELLASDFASITHGDDREGNLELYRRLFDGDLPSFVLDKRFLHKDGSSVWARVSISPVKAESGGPGRAFAIIEDISELKRAEAEAAEKSELLEMASHLARMGGWSIDLARDEVHWSDEVCAIHEMPPGSRVTVSQGIEFFAPECREVLSAAFSRCAREGVPYDLELQILTARGRRVWVRTIAEAERDQSGRIVRVKGAFQDISRVKASEKAAQELAERLTTILESMPDAFLKLDREWRIAYVNAAAEQLIGRSRAELIGKELWAEFPEARNSRIHSEYQRALDEGIRVAFEEYYDPLGKWFRINAFPSGDGLTVYFEDITHRRELEEKLRQVQRMEAIGQLTGGVAHDFNNLLLVIMSNTELIADLARDDHRTKALADTVLTAAERGASLVQRLLSFARQQPLQPRNLDLNDFVRRFCRLIDRTLREDIRVECHLAHAIAPCVADANQLENAALNIVANAQDAMPNGGQIYIETAQAHLDDAYARQNPEVVPGDYVMLAISDTGEGMPADVCDRCFEPFFTTKEVGEGTGLGLSMVYGFAKQSGGHAKVYSEQGEGTTIKLYLPAGAGASDIVLDSGETSALPEGWEHILVVEDDDLVRRQVTTAVESLGYRVSAVKDGENALRTFEEAGDIDAVFTDVVLTGAMNGRQVVEALRERDPGLPALFTSGYTENIIFHEGRLDPGVELLSKPYRKSDLAIALRRVLENGASNVGE